MSKMAKEMREITDMIRSTKYTNIIDDKIQELAKMGSYELVRPERLFRGADYRQFPDKQLKEHYESLGYK